MKEPGGTQETVRIRDENGKIAASVQAEQFPPHNVPTISMMGVTLVLTVQLFENGEPIKAVIRLRLEPGGETIRMTQDLEGSMAQKFGTGKRQKD